MEKWIDVKDKLPEDIDNVIVCLADNAVGYGWYLNGEWFVCNKGDENFMCWSPFEVTHWIPLPEPPKKEN